MLIDGAPADVRAKADLMKVNAPPEGDGPWAIVVTTEDEKTLLGILELYTTRRTGLSR